jgi:prepilin-type N-terminal cleavage/methylation domain-containing protein
MKNTKKGFTLIELLVVIAIIGILSSVVLASLNTARAKSRDARRLADLQQIKLASELYFDANSEYPQDIYATGGAGLAPEFIANVPTDPLNVNYEYNPDADPATTYCLGAEIENLNANFASSSNAACETDLGGTINYAVAP